MLYEYIHTNILKYATVNTEIIQNIEYFNNIQLY